MVYKKYLKKGEKTFGPYYYESYRDNGKVKKRYIGGEKEYRRLKSREENKSFGRSLFIFSLFFLIFFAVSEINTNVKATVSFPENFQGLLKLSGFSVSENSSEFSSKNISYQNYEKEIIEKQIVNGMGSVEIKSPAKIGGVSVTKNKNKKIEFTLSDAKINLYFDLLNYSEFSESFEEDAINIENIKIEETEEIGAETQDQEINLEDNQKIIQENITQGDNQEINQVNITQEQNNTIDSGSEIIETNESIIINNETTEEISLEVNNTEDLESQEILEDANNSEEVSISQEETQGGIEEASGEGIEPEQESELSPQETIEESPQVQEEEPEINIAPESEIESEPTPESEPAPESEPEPEPVPGPAETISESLITGNIINSFLSITGFVANSFLNLGTEENISELNESEIVQKINSSFNKTNQISKDNQILENNSNKISNELIKTEIQEIIDKSITNTEEFDINFNESKEEQYKWSYKFKLNDLNFMAKIHISSDKTITKWNETTVRVGNNLLSFEDLVKQGYNVYVGDLDLTSEHLGKKTSLKKQEAEEIGAETQEQIIKENITQEDSKENITQEQNNTIDSGSEIIETNESIIINNETTEEISLEVNNTEDLESQEILEDVNNSEEVSISQEETQGGVEEASGEGIEPEQESEQESELSPQETIEESPQVQEEEPEINIAPESEIESEPESEPAPESVPEPEPVETISESLITGNIINSFLSITGFVANSFLNLGTEENISETNYLDYEEEYNNEIIVYIERDFKETNYSLGDIIDLDPTLIKLEILNPYTYLKDGEDWYVRFDTFGNGNLSIWSNNSYWREIQTDNGSTVDEMEFLNLSCGGNLLFDSLEIIDFENNTYNYSDISENNSIRPFKFFIQNYSCDGFTGEFVNNMNIAGYATLVFKFENQDGWVIDYAFDPASSCPGYDDGTYCWILGSAGQSCNTVCGANGSRCINSGWNDDEVCTILNELTGNACEGGGCEPGVEVYFPAFFEETICLFREPKLIQNCSIGDPAAQRACACDLSDFITTLGIRRFEIKDSSGNVIAAIDDSGNMFLNGTLTESPFGVYPPVNSFVLKDNAGTVVAYINEGGNLFLKGILTESASMTVSGSNLEIRNSTNSIVAFFDDEGNVNLSGSLTESYSF